MKRKLTKKVTRAPRHRGKVIIIPGRDLSEVEDSPEAFAIISELAALAGKGAVAEAKAAGLPRIFVRNNQIILSHPDGKEEIVETKPPKGGKYFYLYKPGTIFHARKK